jgi:hypothetical protein
MRLAADGDGMTQNYRAAPRGLLQPKLALLPLLYLSACSSETASPGNASQPDADDSIPNFGAVTSKGNCPSGQIGWDFKTGWGRVGADAGAPTSGVVCIPKTCPGSQVRDSKMGCTDPAVDGGLPVVALPDRAVTAGTPFVMVPSSEEYKQEWVRLATQRDDYHGDNIVAGTGQWGDWTDYVFCPPGQWANGYKMRVEANQGEHADDTALNAIELECVSPLGQSTSVRAHEGLWGDWGSTSTCPSGSYLQKARMRIERDQGSGDDTAANNIEFTCSDQSSRLAIPSNQGAWGDVGAEVGCPGNMVVCGISVRFEANQGEGGDDTALNGAKLACCSPPGTGASATNSMRPVYQDVPYTFQAGVLASGAPFRGRMAIWATRQLASAKDPSKTVEAFVCTLNDLALNWDGQAAEALARSRDIGEVVSQECLNGSRADALHDAALAHQVYLRGADKLNSIMDELGSYKAAGPMTFHASFDPVGDINVKATTSSAFVHNPDGNAPNPPGFYYVSDLRAVDWIAYYQQREIKLPTATSATSTDRQWLSEVSQSSFSLPTKLLVGVNDFAFRSPSLLLNPFDVGVPVIKVDVNWFQMGSVAANPYTSFRTTPAVTPTINKLADRSRRLSVEVRPSNSSENWLSLGALALDTAVQGVPTGSVRSGVLTPDRTVLDTFHKQNNVWGTATAFDVRVCFDATGLDPRPESTTRSTRLAAVESGGYQFVAGIESDSTGCKAKTGALSVSREYVVRPLEPQKTSAGYAMADTTTSGGSDSSASQSTNGSKTCEDVAGTTTRQCTQTNRSSSDGAGFLGNPLYNTETIAVNNDSDTTASGSGRTKGGVMNFNIIDTGDSEATKFQFSKADGPPPGIDLNIQPNLSAIIAASKATGFTAYALWGGAAIVEKTVGKLGGLSVGWQWKTVVDIGPIPGEISFVISAGVAVGLELKATFAPADGDEYPCINDDGSKCFSVPAGAALSQADAQKKCADMGGRLAEIASQDDRDGIMAAATEDSNYWIGGQTAYVYDSTNCRAPIASQYLNSCRNNSTTTFRWIGSDREFAKRSGVNGAVDYESYTNIPARPPGGMQLDTYVPYPAGVVYQGRFQRMTTLPQDVKLPFVCEWDGAKSVRYASASATLGLDASCGVSLSFFVPNSDVGIGIVGNVDFIGINLSLEGGYFQHTLFDGSGKWIGTRGAGYFDIPWSVALLRAGVNVQLVTPILTVSWPLLQYPGFIVAQGKLFDRLWPSREGTSPAVQSPTSTDPPSSVLPFVAEGASSSAAHDVGYVNTTLGGWYAKPGSPGSGYLLKANSGGKVPSGGATASFRLQVDNNTGADQVCTLEIVNKDTGAAIATRTLTRSDFGAQGSPVDIVIPFNLATAATVEVRVNWLGNTGMGVQRVVIDARRSDYVGPITVADGMWGTWKGIQLCPGNGFAMGYRQRVEPDQGSGDDTGMNGLELDCMNTQGVHTPLTYAGLWGNWSEWNHCAPGDLISGGALSVEPDRGSGGDDTAANSLKMRCKAHGELSASNGAPWGTYGDWAVCPTGQAVCGMEIRFEDDQGDGDDTALNGVHLVCCTAPAFINDITYVFRPSHAVDKCVEVAGDGMAAGSGIDIVDCKNSSLAQQFRAVAVDGSWFELQNLVSGKCIEVASASTTTGAGLQQNTCGLGNHQHWQGRSVADGTFEIANRNGGMVWDLAGAQATANGTILNQGTYDGSGDQKYQVALGTNAYIALQTNDGMNSIGNRNGEIWLDAGDPSDNQAFIVRPGLSDASCVSFESKSKPGSFLAHRSEAKDDLLYLDVYPGADGTFCPRAALSTKAKGGVSFEAVNHKNYYLYKANNRVQIAQFVDNTTFRADATWIFKGTH